MALDPNAPQTPPADPTATTGLAKKAPALPLAPAAPTASPTLSGSNPTATTQPVGPVTPAGPATTSDPMAFAPNGGGTPAITPDPVATTQPTDWGAMLGKANNAGNVGWSDGIGNAVAGPDMTELTPDAFAARAAQDHRTAMDAASAASGWNAPGMKYDGQAGHYDNTNPTPVPVPGLNGMPTTTPATTSPTGTPTSKFTPGPANDVNTSGQLPWTPQVSATPTPSGPAGSTGGLNGMPATTTTSNGTVAMTPTDPAHSLMSQTLSVGPTADRFKLAQDEWDQAQKASEPAYEATLTAQDAHDFGMGRGVSGMHRNSIGDIATQRATAMDTQKKTFLDQALNSSVDDAYKNVGIQQQQQQFQESLQEQAFRQGLSLQQLSDAENSQSFQQAYQKALLGFSGNPAQLYIQLAAEWAKTGATA